MEHTLERITNAQVVPEPFPHFFVEDVFDEPTYQYMCSSLYRTPMQAYQSSFPYHKHRWFIEPTRVHIVNLNQLIGLVVNKLQVKLPSVASQHIHASFDMPGYQLVPHLDTPDQLCTVLFYLSGDAPHGTTLYRPKQPDFRITDEQQRHFPFEWFDEVKTLPFKQNSAFGMKWTADSWHGVKPVKTLRQTMTWLLKIPTEEKSHEITQEEVFIGAK